MHNRSSQNSVVEVTDEGCNSARRKLKLALSYLDGQPYLVRIHNHRCRKSADRGIIDTVFIQKPLELFHVAHAENQHEVFFPGNDACRFDDCWRLLGRLRTVLSSEEIIYLREAARYANIGIDTFYTHARVGMSEIELAAEIEYAMRAAGSDYFAVPTWMASGERAHCQHAMASPRKLKAGDLVHAEFAGVARRYQCVTMGSLTLGEPTARMRQMAQGGSDAFNAGLAAARIGARIGDIESAYRELLAEQGLGDCCPMRFGVGISAAYPPVWENQITIQYECDDLLEAGMAFYIHASMQSFDDNNGMLLGGSFLISADGPERLDKAPIALVEVEV
jgi:Xaa-Pro dipeptidase